MKKQITLVLFLLLSFTTFSQIKFEKGYFISNEGSKTECLIKNYDWENNPEEITYKITKSDKPKIITIENVKEYVVFNEVKYERHTLNIDKSSQTLQSLSESRAPEWEEKTVFLKVLVDGNYDLFNYKDRYIKEKYFYRVDNSDVEQLVYKHFLTTDGEKNKNLTYLYQLRKYVNCNNFSEEKLYEVDYSEYSLTKYFTSNNECLNPTSAQEDDDFKRRPKINISLNTGVNKNSYNIWIHNRYEEVPFDFGGKFTVGLGIEAELLLPVRNYKWSFFIQPNYKYFSAESSAIIMLGKPVTDIEEKAYADFRSIELPFGFRYYFYLKNKEAKLFLSAMLVFDLYSDYKVEFDHLYLYDNFEKDVTSAIGIGYTHKDKYNIEARITQAPYLYKENYAERIYGSKQFSLLFGYKFL